MTRLLRWCTVLATLILVIEIIAISLIVRKSYQDSFMVKATNNSHLLAFTLTNDAASLATELIKRTDQTPLTSNRVHQEPIWNLIQPYIGDEKLHASEVILVNTAGTAVYSSSPYTLNETIINPAIKDAFGGKHATIQVSQLPSDSAIFSLLGSNSKNFISCNPIFDNNQTSMPPIGALCVRNDYSLLYSETIGRRNQTIFKLSLSILLIYLITITCIYFIYTSARRAKKNYNAVKQQLNHHTQHDDLTGLPNRQRFIEHIEYLVEQCSQNEHENMAILMMDLDNFRSINQTMGHQAGNHILKQTAKRLKQIARSEDLVSRLSNDEFTVVMRNVRDVDQVISQAKLVQAEFQAPFKLRSRYISDTISIGINIVQGKKLNADAIIRDANIALSQAKIRGRGSFEVFNQNMHLKALERVELEANLQRAMKTGEFFNRYHPIVDIQTGITHSFEALVRWNTPNNKEVMPDHFISVCEELGMIPDLDSRVLEEAVSDLTLWRKNFPDLENLSVNVNHSAQNFRRRPILDNIIGTLSKHNLNGRYLKIELTESVMFENERTATSIFQELRDNHIHLCMDDFGTGFSSLSYLHKFNFDMLKIDKSFIMDMNSNREAYDIVQTIINMGDNMSISVAAEGVETEQQLNALREMGCRYAQGYLFSEPLKASEVSSFIKKQLKNRS